MDAEELLIAIRTQIAVYQSKSNAAENISIVISTENLGILIRNTEASCNIKVPKEIKEIKLFGCHVIPSDFIENNCIIVSTKQIL